MATYRPDGTRIRKRDKKKNRGNVEEGNVGAGSSTSPPPIHEPAPEPAPEHEPAPESEVGIGTTA